MRRRLALITAAVLTAVFLSPAPARADRADQWRAIAAQALVALEALPVDDQPITVAHQLGAVAALSGWEDPRVPTLLARLDSARNPDGGWGLDFPYDAFGDGTTNPATTTYTVTLSGHVGPVLLAGWRAGAVPLVDVQAVVGLLVSTPRIDSSAGRCFAYSRAPADVQPGYCVHNVNAITAAFLLDAAQDAVPAASWWLIAGATKREASAYNHATKWWPYRDGVATPADADHTSAEAEAVYALAMPVGYSSAYTIMVNGYYPGEPTSPIAHLRLTGLPPHPAAMSGITTLWCVLGDQWLPEAQAYVTAQTAQSATVRLAQAAHYAARAAQACT